MTLKQSGTLVETISFGSSSAGMPSFVSATSNACRPGIVEKKKNRMKLDNCGNMFVSFVLVMRNAKHR